MPTSSEVVGIVVVVVPGLVFSGSGFLFGSFTSDTRSCGLSGNSVFFLSPEVSNGVVEEGESHQLETDVEHLEVNVKPEGVNHLFVGVSAFGTPSDSFFEVVVLVEVFVIIN